MAGQRRVVCACRVVRGRMVPRFLRVPFYASAPVDTALSYTTALLFGPGRCPHFPFRSRRENTEKCRGRNGKGGRPAGLPFFSRAENGAEPGVPLHHQLTTPVSSPPPPPPIYPRSAGGTAIPRIPPVVVVIPGRHHISARRLRTRGHLRFCFHCWLLAAAEYAEGGRPRNGLQRR
jgi:hypothetical protein